MVDIAEGFAGKRPLTRSVSVYLDLLRLIAALAVFVGHAGKFLFGRFQHGIPHFLFTQGGSAVAVFFVLSGFVISFVSAEKESDWRSYVAARASRIYSVALLALVVTMLADFAGNYFNPQHYIYANSILHFYKPVAAHSALRLVSFTNELWFSHVVFGTDEPYWSLGFEVTYYALFGFLVFMPGKIRMFAVSLWFLVAGPKIALYLPLWLIGVGTYKILAGRPVRIGAPLAVLAFVFPVVFYVFLWREISPLVIPMYQLGTPGRELLSFYFFTLTGILVSMNIIAFHALAGGRTVWPVFAARWIRWAAGASFTLYLVHQPLIVAASAIFPMTAKHGVYGAVACLVILGLALGLAELGERRKRVFAAPIGWLVHAVFPQPRAAGMVAGRRPLGLDLH